MEFSQLSDIALVATMQTLHEECRPAIDAREMDFLLERAQVMSDDHFINVVKFIQNNKSLHDKFWRYLTLFSDTVSKAWKHE